MIRHELGMVTLLEGDVLEGLAALAAGSVQCAVTSPPYWGLRDYGTGSWEGGAAGCDHVERERSDAFRSNGLGPSGHLPETNAAFVSKVQQYRDVCGKCGARRVDQQIGLERTPAEYVERLVDVFRAVRRVLRDDGVLWINLGDSYAGGGGYSPGAPSNQAGSKQASNPGSRSGGLPVGSGLKPKDLVGIPWRVAFALQADGWYLRSDCIWSKPSPMPESITDRPTRSHEYVFMFAKSERYFWDQHAVAEPAVSLDATRSSYRPNAVEIAANGRKTFSAKNEESMRSYAETRNLRTVWTLTTEPTRDAHFATFPRKLVERCIKAGTSERGACSVCGAPFARVIERVGGPPRGDHRKDPDFDADYKSAHPTGTVAGHSLKDVYLRHGYAENRTTGWAPTCEHADAAAVSCVVLDPFMGSGTTAQVALEPGRRAVGCELNPAYVEIARRRLERSVPLFTGGAVEFTNGNGGSTAPARLEELLPFEDGAA